MGRSSSSNSGFSANAKGRPSGEKMRQPLENFSGVPVVRRRRIRASDPDLIARIFVRFHD
jgi:hypothetical protein